MIWIHLWPGGTWWSGFDAVWPNILASAIVFTAGYFVGIRSNMKRIHSKLHEIHQHVKKDNDH